MTKVELYRSRIFVTIIHSAALAQFAYALFFDLDMNKGHIVSPSNRVQQHPLLPNEIFKKANLLTYWSLIIQAFYFTVCLANDFFGTLDAAPKARLPRIRRLKDYLMATLAFPVALNVGITFWSLYAIDRELVLPRILDPVFPGWLNHIMHTNIVVFIILEMFTSFRAYPKRSSGITGLSVFMISYLIWIHVVKHYSGVWVYPVLEVLELPQRILFFVAVLGFTLFLYVLGESVNNMVWHKELKATQRKVK